MQHPAIAAGRTAVITGGASGIGLAAARHCQAQGMHLCLADRDSQALSAAAATLSGDVLTVTTDVADPQSVHALFAAVIERFGEVGFLMNNAGTAGGGAALGHLSGWQRVIGVNLWGVVHGLQTFVPAMIEQGTPCAVVNTGSKQGITNPPGDAAYNVSKAGVRSVTESLAHELRGVEGCQVSAHLLVPGFTYTGMVQRHVPEKPPAAWTPEQVVERLFARLAAGDFYILCPDNDVTLAMDAARLQWNTDDIKNNRPALSRWHSEYAQAYARFVADATS